MDFPFVCCNFAHKVYLMPKMDNVLTKKLQEYFKTKPISKAWVFGSYARGEERPDSDVDILVELLPGTKMGLAFCAMICDLEDALNRPVDLVREGCIKPYAIESIEHDKILVYERTS